MNNNAISARSPRRSPVSSRAIIGISVSVFLAAIMFIASYQLFLYHRRQKKERPTASSSPTTSYAQPTPPLISETHPVELPHSDVLEMNAIRLQLPRNPAPTSLQPVDAHPPAPSPSRSSGRSSQSRKLSNASALSEGRGPQAGQPYYASAAQSLFPQFQG